MDFETWWRNSGAGPYSQKIVAKQAWQAAASAECERHKAARDETLAALAAVATKLRVYEIEEDRDEPSLELQRARDVIDRAMREN